jgi:hypothetical protein
MVGANNGKLRDKLAWFTLQLSSWIKMLLC